VRFRVHFNAHYYSDNSDPAQSRSRVIKAETAEEAEQVISEVREQQWRDLKPWAPLGARARYIGLIHFGHTEEA
jgi:hypothetical protein